MSRQLSRKSKNQQLINIVRENRGTIGSVIVALSTLISQTAHSAEYVTKISDVLYPIGAPGSVKALVKTSDYQVYSVDGANTDLIARLWRLKEKGDVGRITYEEDKILGVEAAGGSPQMKSEKPTTPYAWYQPSQFEVKEQAQGLMDDLTKESLSGKSECWQRAHYWTHSLWRDHGIKTEKIFLFFTKPYRIGRNQHLKMCEDAGSDYAISKCEFKFFDHWYRLKREAYFYKNINQWDFHVAPLVTAGNEPWVLDPAFNFTKDERYNDDDAKENHFNVATTVPRKVMNIKDWTDMFVRTHKECKEVKTYAEVKAIKDSEYTSEDCVYMRVPMYYMGPDNLDSGPSYQLNDTWNVYQTDKLACKAPVSGDCGHWKSEDERAKSYMEKHF